ncbi:MAG: phosphoglycolate phosphatase [Humisphaera sp.]|nr:phosphoglycolate phosphatase [Humisphaera sp.]
MSRLAIFDCDGTLVDSGATIVRAVAETFEQHGLAVPTPRECRQIIGLSLGEAMRALVPEGSCEKHAALTETYKQKFFQARLEGRVEEPLFDGIAELLDALEADGWMLAVATGKSDRGLGHCLDCHGWSDRFVSLQTGDRHPSKPHPSMALQAMADAGAAPESTVVIGDTSYDMGMARAAGATGIGAGWGYHDESELLAAGASAVAMEPGEVPGLLPGAKGKLYA